MASLVVQTSFLGDVVLTTPLIAELAKRGAVDVLTTPEGSAILANNPSIRQILVFDRRDADRGMGGFARTIGRIRKAGAAEGESYNAAYLCQGSFRSAILIFTSGIERRIGFNTSEGCRLYTHRVEYRADRHHAERLWWLAGAEGPPGEITPELFPSKEDEHAVDKMLSDSLDDSLRPVVVLAPGSAWGTKRWPFYHELAVKVGENANVAIVGGNSEVATGDAIVAQLEVGRAVNACGRLNILASAALIRRAQALVSNDSAPQHLASAMGTPTVSIFGPTVPGFGFGPLAPGSAVAGNVELACRPCDKHGPQQCPLGHWRCMRELSSEHVFEILNNTLSTRANV